MPITRHRLVHELDPDLTCLSAAERLFLWRHRRRHAERGRSRASTGPRPGAAMNQPEAADFLRVGRSAYTALEAGDRTRLSAADLNALAAAIDSVGEPTTGELCFIARRRTARPLAELCAALAVSKPRFHELERDGDPAVVAYWEATGLRFPGKGAACAV